MGTMGRQDWAHVGCVLTKSVGQTITDQVTGGYQALTWDSEIFDADNMHDNTTNTERITVHSFTGTLTYQVTAFIRWNAAATGTRRVRLRKNASTIIAEDFAAATDYDLAPLTISALVEAAPNDYFVVEAWQDTWANRVVNPVSRFAVAACPS